MINLAGVPPSDKLQGGKLVMDTSLQTYQVKKSTSLPRIKIPRGQKRDSHSTL